MFVAPCLKMPQSKYGRPAMSRLSRNDPCPCGSSKKFKHCCLGKVDWNHIIASRLDPRPYLSVRGKNIAFINKMADLFLLDKNSQTKPLAEYKKAFTATAVRELNEEIVRLWPRDTDIKRVLQSSKGDVSGLYIGDYSPDQLLHAIVRHSLYATKLLIVDPFIYPLSVRDEYSPLLNPEQYRAQTLRNVNLWFSLAPWIEAGLVEVIRTPADFDHKLQWESMKLQEEKFSTTPALQAAAEITVDEMKERHIENWKFRDLVLSRPDESLISEFEKLASNEKDVSKEDLLAYVHQKREEDPDFLEPMGMGKNESQLTIFKSGTMYNVACLTATLTGSYLVTDMYSRWKEIELDREGRSGETQAWSPFARAFQDAEFKYLNNVSIQDALTLRKEERLLNFRTFLRRVWKQACDPQSFDQVNGKLLAEELQSEVHKADDEWKQIDRELVKYAGAAGAGLITSMPMIGSGQGAFLAAASLLAGGSAVAASTWQRHGFEDKFPAAFFLRL
jgi:hypothetical protein